MSRSTTTGSGRTGIGGCAPATGFRPLAVPAPPKRKRRRWTAVVAAALLLVGAGALRVALTNREEAPPQVVVPNSLVQIDPTTFEPTDVVPIGAAPDRVVTAGGFVWVTHYVLRDIDSGALRNAGDRTLTRIDPSTDNAVVVGGGLEHGRHPRHADARRRDSSPRRSAPWRVGRGLKAVRAPSELLWSSLGR